MTTHTLRLIDEYLTQGGHAPNIDADTLDREAMLVAAAPDLLAALITLVWQMDRMDNLPEPAEDMLAHARDAITKATGA